MATYLTAINRHIEAKQPRLVALDDASLRAARQSRYSAAGASATAGPANVSDTDILDWEFIDFHRALREHMLDNFGVLAESEAFDLHEAIAPCVRIHDPNEVVA